MTTRTSTPTKTGPKAASKTTRKATPNTAAKAAPKADAAVEPKVFPPAVVEEAATVETSESTATVEASEAAAAVEIPVKSAPTVAGNYDDFAAVQKDSVDAFVKAGEAFAKGVEELSKACFDLAQETAASNAEAAAAMLAVTSLDELVGLQNELARKAFDRSIAEGTRISEMSLKIANEAFEPIQAQVNVAVEKALKPLAA